MRWETLTQVDRNECLSRENLRIVVDNTRGISGRSTRCLKVYL